MKTYADSSALVPLYVTGRFSDSAQCRLVLQHLQEDVESQRLSPSTMDLERVFADAGELSRRYAARFLARSLDLLHVAAAHIALCKTFVSADDRQLAVAKASGLSVVDVKRRPRRRRP